MKKEHEVFKIKNKFPKHEQLVLVKKLEGKPFLASFEIWLGNCTWVIFASPAIKTLSVEETDKWIPIYNKLF